MMILLAGNPEVNFGCGLGDFGCVANENMAKFLVGGIIGMGDFAGDTIKNAFDQSISNSQWAIAFTEWGKWAGAMMIFVGIVMIYQIAIGFITLSPNKIRSAVIGGLFAVPVSAVAVAIMARVTGAADEATMKITSAATQNGAVGTAIMTVLGLKGDDSAAFNGAGPIGGALNQVNVLKDAGSLLLTFIFVVLILLASFVLLIGVTIRNDGLLILAGVAPIALMMIGQGKLHAWSERWVSLVAGLLLAKPISVGIVSMLLGLLGGGVMKTFADVTVPVIFLFVVGFAPFWVVKMFDFVGGELGGAMASRPRFSAGAQRGSRVTNVMRTATRVVAHPVQSAKTAAASALKLFRRGK